MVMTPFRRSIRADSKRSGGKGRRGNVYERYRPPVGVPSPFALINAEYVDPNPSQDEVETDPATGRPREVKKPYFKVRMHKRAITRQGGGQSYRNSVCSSGYNPHAPQPCAGCMGMDQGDRSIGLGDLAVFGMVHLAVYHAHPLIDRQTGGYIMKRDSNPPVAVMVDDECSGRTCNYCRALSGQPLVNDPENPWPGYRPQDIQTHFGKRRFMELGKNHLSNLEAWDSTISSLCGNDGSQLITDAFVCPSCGNMVIDMNQDPRTDQQIAEVVSKPYPCLQCNRPVLLREVVACEVCEQNHRQPVQYTLFDRVLWGMRQGEQTASQLVLHRHESLDEFAARVPPQILGGKTVRQIVEELAKPYDFAKLYEPKNLQDQMKDLEMRGQGPVPGQVGPVSYGPPQGTYQPAQQPGYGPPAGYGPPTGYVPQAVPPPQQSPYPQIQPPGQPPVQQYSQPVQQPAPGPQAPAPVVQPHFGTGRS